MLRPHCPWPCSFFFIIFQNFQIWTHQAGAEPFMSQAEPSNDISHLSDVARKPGTGSSHVKPNRTEPSRAVATLTPGVDRVLLHLVWSHTRPNNTVDCRVVLSYIVQQHFSQRNIKLHQASIITDFFFPCPSNLWFWVSHWVILNLRQASRSLMAPGSPSCYS